MMHSEIMDMIVQITIYPIHSAQEMIGMFLNYI